MKESIRHRLGPIAGVVTLTIGIGFVAVLHAVLSMFPGPATDSPTPVPPHYDFHSAPRVEPPATATKGPTEFSCYDPHLLPIWTELKKDSEFKDRIGEDEGTLSCSDLLETKSVDLNNDGRDEFLVRGKDSELCSAVGNCGFWILEMQGRRGRILLSASDFYEDQGQFGEQVQKARTRGYSNILLKGHFSAAETGYTTYSFHGKRYVESHCMFEVPKYDRTGEGSVKLITCQEFADQLEKEQ